MRRVVVGIEELPRDEAALDWAAAAAGRSGATLVLVCASDVPESLLDRVGELPSAEAEDLLARATARALGDAPELRVDARVDPRRPAEALLDDLRHDDLLVVSTHRLTDSGRVVARAFAHEMASEAPCPVAVVPGRPAEGAAGVVVGVDGSQDSLAAVEVAADICDWTGEDLHVVHARTDLALSAGWSLPLDVVAGHRDEERVLLGESVAGLAERHPDLVVHQELQHDDPAAALLAAAEHAQLVVLGSRGRHGLARLLLGSTSHAVALHARCPVLVVRTAREASSEG